MVSERILIEEARTREDFEAMERLQCETWSRSGMVPASMLMVTVESGGLALVARDGERVVGFAFALLGHDGRRPWFWSHMAAVEPEYRGSGVGAALKFRQYQVARERGVPLITWTFDPLQAGNANFNLARLGAIARRFLPNHYGEMDDPLNRGLPSDRLWCEWWVVPGGPRLSVGRSASGASRADATARTDIETLLVARAGKAGLPEPVLQVPVSRATGGAGSGAVPHPAGTEPVVTRFQTPEPPVLLRDDEPGTSPPLRWSIEIPLDFLGLKAKDIGLARAWREASGEAFTGAFQDGAVAVGFARDTSRGVGSYLLVPSP